MAEFVALALAPAPEAILEGVSAFARVVAPWAAASPTAAGRRAGEAIDALAPQVRALLTTAFHAPIDGAEMNRFPALELIACLGVGYDHVDVAAAAARGVVVTHTPDVLSDEVADTAMGLMLNAVRRLHEADQFVRTGRWTNGSFPLTESLRGRTLGIAGLGRIGCAIAARAQAFGLKIVYHNRRPRSDVAYEYRSDLVDLARVSDILVAVMPGGPATRGVIGADVFTALGPNGYFINVGRGASVDEGALITALERGAIAGAGLDVFADEPRVPQALIGMAHVALAPHVGSATRSTRDAMSQLVVDNVAAYVRGEGPLTPVPETPWPAILRARR